jgi:flagellar biosynthesis GTPase FlhF
VSKDIKEYFADKVIKVDRGGPESRIGKVLDASDDYFAVLTENDGVVYYNTHHIKSFTENMKGQFEFDVEVPKDFKFKKAENFKELLESLKYVWVKINRGGPDTVEGVLGEVKNDCVYLIANEEIVRITMFHIKNVSYGVKVENAESREHESREHESREHESREYESREYESREYESREHESREYESREHESREHESREHESREYESREYESREHESQEHESQEHESQEHQSRQKSNDESKNKKNKTNSSTEVDRQNLEDDLLVLLSSMEKFLRNYSKSN